MSTAGKKGYGIIIDWELFGVISKNEIIRPKRAFIW